jgi:hypothetical protein
MKQKWKRRALSLGVFHHQPLCLHLFLTDAAASYLDR